MLQFAIKSQIHEDHFFAHHCRLLLEIINLLLATSRKC